MTDTFSVTSERLTGSLAVIALSGEVDIYTAPQFKEHMRELLDAGVTDLVVDLTQVGFIDSTALGVLIGGVRRVNSVGGAMALVVVTRPVQRILSITGLDRVFSLYDTREDALQSLA
jgi:anti-sigma B factor antagonist